MTQLLNNVNGWMVTLLFIPWTEKDKNATLVDLNDSPQRKEVKQT